VEWRASNNLKTSLDVLYRPQLAVNMRAQTMPLSSNRAIEVASFLMCTIHVMHLSTMNSLLLPYPEPCSHYRLDSSRPAMVLFFTST
jgi:hypothetical protein